MRTQYCNIRPYQTKDGSLIRELMHPEHHGNTRMSVAEAIIPVNAATHLHRHGQSEEIYYVTAGSGIMNCGLETFPVATGDTIAIPPGTPHKVCNTGGVPLTILCCCSPAYSHADTEMLEEGHPPVGGEEPEAFTDL